MNYIGVEKTRYGNWTKMQRNYLNMGNSFIDFELLLEGRNETTQLNLQEDLSMAKFQKLCQ